MLMSLIPPIAGNLIVVIASNELLANVGYYMYFLGMDLTMIAVLNFTFSYCKITWKYNWIKYLVVGLFAIDFIQYVANPFLHQAFKTTVEMLDGFAYYKFAAYYGQVYHRLLDYGMLFAVMFIYFYKMTHTPRIYAERYYVIFITIVVVALWESFYIISRTPIDRSMIGFGVFGLLVFYFSIFYRPVLLLDRMLANIASDLPQALFFFDNSGLCVWANGNGIELAGIKGNDFEAATEYLTSNFSKLKKDEDNWTNKGFVTIDGEEKFFLLDRHLVYDDRGRRLGYSLSLTDNTEEELAYQKNRYNATHDSLTGLYNKDYLFERIEKAVSSNKDKEYYIVYANVSGFKIVNDIFGNEFGDSVLKYISEMLRVVSTEDTIYGRMQGDTFGMCIPVSDFDEKNLENNLLDFEIAEDNVKYNIVIHLGVYKVSDVELDVSVMFDRAKMALSTIKDDYQTHIAYYDDDMRDKVLWEKRITSDVSDAIITNQIVPYLQPIMNNSGKLVGAEALVRWIHPLEGYLSPGLFIPALEKNGMIAEVDKFMWKSACETLARWKKGHGDLFISINISPIDFYFMDIAYEIKKITRQYGINPSQLRIEITESAMMTDLDNRISLLNDLRNAGFIVEMDDFGSGYSSFNMLKDMPIDVLKIDMVFLRKSKDDDKATKILDNIISLASTLEISSLTEGVETKEHYDMLSSMGCELFQGFYFSKPIPIDDFEEKFL